MRHVFNIYATSTHRGIWIGICLIPRLSMATWWHLRALSFPYRFSKPILSSGGMKRGETRTTNRFGLQTNTSRLLRARSRRSCRPFCFDFHGKQSTLRKRDNIDQYWFIDRWMVLPPWELYKAAFIVSTINNGHLTDFVGVLVESGCCPVDFCADEDELRAIARHSYSTLISKCSVLKTRHSTHLVKPAVLITDQEQNK